MPPFHIDYFCPREFNGWQRYKFLGLIDNSYATVDEGVAAANDLIWRYHSARVVDSQGNVVYQV